jgi:hypothetical protein
MRPARDLLLAVSWQAGPAPPHLLFRELEPVVAVEPWSAPASAAFPAPLSDLEHLRAEQKRRPWVLLWKVLFFGLLVWFAGWMVLHLALHPTRSQRKATQVTDATHPGGPV